jgi:hypothetical protein
MIELTNEQIDALEGLGDEPLVIVNPHTQVKFLLTPLDEPKRAENDDEYDDSPWTPEEMLLMADRVAEEAGWMEWPEEDEKKS